MNEIIPISTPPSIGQPAVVVIRNPLQPEIVDHEFVQEGLSVTEVLENFDLTSHPTLVLFNTMPLLEEDWDDTYLQHGDIITLVREPGEPITAAVIAFWVIVAISVITTAYSLYMILTMDMPDPGEDRNSPNYSVTYRGNQRRPGEPIPVCYGELRVYPDYSGKYSTYLNNDQWLYQIFDIGLGEFETITDADVYYEDTPITNFDQYAIEHVPPGATSDIFPSNELVSSEVQNLEFTQAMGTNFTSWYVVNPVGTTITEITFDVVAPQGMYRIKKESGSYRQWHATMIIEWRLVGGGNEGTMTRTVGYSKKAARHSFSTTVTEGRYEVRMRRNVADDPYSDVSDTVMWERVRGTEPDKTVTETTRLAIKVRASETLGTQALSKMNVLAKRKVPIWNGTSWSAPTHTKNAAWAFADACRADYGGRYADSKVDLDDLLALASRNVEFNGVFDSKTTLWDALNSIARPFLGRAIEKPGGVLSIKTDDENVAPSAMYTMRNIIKDSFGIEHNFPPQQDVNFVRVTFKNKDENYRETSIDCVPSGITPDEPYEVTLRGVTDYTTAYDIGLRMANESRWRRKRVAFKTGLEGFIPNAFDTIRVAHYQIGLEQTVDSVSGEIHSNSGTTMNVYEDLSHLVGQGSLQCYVMDVDGSPWGPVSCTVTANTINLSSMPPAGVLVYGNDRAGPKYAVGQTSDFMMLCKVTSVKQTGEHEIQIEAIEDNPNAYIGDAPPTYSPLDPPFDISPVIHELHGYLVGSDQDLDLRLIWKGDFADYYIVEMSEDSGTTWTEMDRTKEEQSQIPVPYANGLLVRVRGVSLLVGKPYQIVVNVRDASIGYPGVHNLHPTAPFEGSLLTMAWDPLQPGETALIEFIAPNVSGSPVLHSARLSANETTYSLTMDMILAKYSRKVGQIAFPVEGSREILVRLTATALIDGSWSDSPQSSEVTVINDQMGPLHDVKYREKNRTLDVTFDWPSHDVGGVEVHLSTTSGFTPGASTLKYRGNSDNLAIAEVLDFPETYYLKMAGYDVFGPDSDMVYSIQETISTTDDSFSGDIEWENITDPNGTKPEDNADRSAPGIVNHDPNFDILASKGWGYDWDRTGSSSNILQWSDGSNGINGVQFIPNGSPLDIRTSRLYECAEGDLISVRAWGSQWGLSNAANFRIKIDIYRGDLTLLRSVNITTFSGFASTVDSVTTGFYRVPEESTLANTPRFFKIGAQLSSSETSGSDSVYLASLKCVLGGYSEWQDVLDSEGKPQDNADVTKDNLGGDGINRITPIYASFWESDDIIPWKASTGAVNDVYPVGGQGIVGEAALKVEFLDPLGQEHLYFPNDLTPIAVLDRNKRWIFSVWSMCSAASEEFNFHLKYVAKGVLGNVGASIPSTVYHPIQNWVPNGNTPKITTSSTPGVWKQHIFWLDLTNEPDIFRIYIYIRKINPGADDLYLDGMFMEQMVSDKVPTIDDLSGFSSGPGKLALPTSNLGPESVMSRVFDDTLDVSSLSANVSANPFSNLDMSWCNNDDYTIIVNVHAVLSGPLSNAKGHIRLYLNNTTWEIPKTHTLNAASGEGAVMTHTRMWEPGGGAPSIIDVTLQCSQACNIVDGTTYVEILEVKR